MPKPKIWILWIILQLAPKVFFRNPQKISQAPNVISIKSFHRIDSIFKSLRSKDLHWFWLRCNCINSKELEISTGSNNRLEIFRDIDAKMLLKMSRSTDQSPLVKDFKIGLHGFQDGLACGRLAYFQGKPWAIQGWFNSGTINELINSLPGWLVESICLVSQFIDLWVVMNSSGSHTPFWMN